MWKIVLAFIAFAAIALFILVRSGGDVDLGGEKHSVDAAPHGAAPAASAAMPASAASR